MGVSSIRPKSSELVFQLFGRPLHPELFDVVASREIRRSAYGATIQITDASHVITWRRGSACLCEVAAPAGHPLPRRRRLLSHRLAGHRDDSLQYANGAAYQVSFQLEKLEPELFWLCNQELEIDGPQRGLFHQFRSRNRLGLGPISHVTYEARPRTLLVQSFHTFPEEHTLFKSQSLFEVLG